MDVQAARERKEQMGPEKMLKLFFAAENNREWGSYVRFLHPEIEWELHAEGTKTVCGIEQYMSAITAAYEGSEVRFSARSLEISDDGSRAAALLVNDRGERSMDVFEFKEELIYREYEFLLDGLAD